MAAPNYFEGELVRLRAREPEDEPLLYQWFNDPEVIEFLSVRYPLSHQQEKDYNASHGAPSFQLADFAIVRKDTGELIGNVDLRDVSPESRGAGLGIAIGDRRCWDGGFGTDAMRVVCRFAFEMMNLHRIQLEVIDGNDRARHVYEKIGFRHEGTLREAFYKAGSYRDIHVMGLLRGELR